MAIWYSIVWVYRNLILYYWTFGLLSYVVMVNFVCQLDMLYLD